MRRLMLVAVALVGCEKSARNMTPVAVLGDDIRVLPTVEVSLSGAGSSDPDGEIVRYDWSFGDGATAQGVDVKHTWDEEGTYAVQLTVTDDRNGQGTAAIKVTVTTGDNTPPTAVVDGPGRGMPGQMLSFSGQSSTDSDGTIGEYHWDMGDGTMTTGPTVDHAFATEGTFSVTLVVVDDDDEAGQASRAVIVSTDPDNQTPIAEAGPDKTAEIGIDVELDGRGSSDPDGSIVAYTWDFGDGAMGNTPRATHAYAAEGAYTVTLTVEDDEGLTASDTMTVTVAPPASYDGTWILNPNMTSVTCGPAGRTYQVPFPAAQIALMGTTTAQATGEVVGQGRTMSGEVDRTVAPPELSLDWSGNDSSSSCGTATVEHHLSAKMTPTTMMDGRFSVLLTWSDPLCTCAKTFMLTGVKQ